MSPMIIRCKLVRSLLESVRFVSGACLVCKYINLLSLHGSLLVIDSMWGHLSAYEVGSHGSGKAGNRAPCPIKMQSHQKSTAKIALCAYIVVTNLYLIL